MIIFITTVSKAFSQGWISDENKFVTNWNLTLQTGATLLVGEVNNNFSGLNNNMNNLPQVAINIQMAKMIYERFDLGTEIGISRYQGKNKFPSDVGFLVNSGQYDNFLPYPINYQSDISNLSIYAKYNFINFRSFETGFIKLNLFVRFGVGIAYISSKLGYEDPANYIIAGLSDPLWASGRYSSSNKKVHFIAGPAIGLNYQLSDRFFISAETSFQVINADYIDGITNSYNHSGDSPIDQLRQNQNVSCDVTGKLMFGISYFFNFTAYRKHLSEQYPWFYSRYKSYFSKYQIPSTKKARQDRLPFYNDKFEE